MGHTCGKASKGCQPLGSGQCFLKGLDFAQILEQEYISEEFAGVILETGCADLKRQTCFVGDMTDNLLFNSLRLDFWM